MLPAKANAAIARFPQVVRPRGVGKERTKPVRMRTIKKPLGNPSLRPISFKK
jgi:hypothetical protein